MSDEKMRNKRSRKRKTRKPLWLKLIIILLGALILITVIGMSIFYSTLSKMDKVDLNKSDLGLTPKEELQNYDSYNKIENIALFGIDSTDGSTSGRSDSIMIATIDSTHKKLKATSIMRDSYVNIEGYGYDKINHAYAYGGPQLSIKTINQNFGLNIENFVAVDFSSLPIIIDKLGGLQINITEEELLYINKYVDQINKLHGTSSPHIISAGEQTVDGGQALAYSRIRSTAGGDYERTQRQRTVLNGLFEKAMTIAPSKYLGLINSILPHVQTNLSANSILSLATKVASIGTKSLEQERFPRDDYSWGDNINGVYYLVFDEAVTKQQMMDYIFDDKKE